MGFIKNIIIKIFEVFFFLFPVKNKKIFFSNFNGKGYGDSPKSIYEALKELHPDWTYIWWINNKKANTPKDVVFVSNRIKAMFHMATSKVIVNNVKDRMPFIKKRTQFYLQTWHAGVYYKLVEQDAEAFLSKRYIKSSKKESRITDAVISDNLMESSDFKRNFYYNDKVEILEYGCPRNDVFFHINKEEVNNFKKEIGVPLDSKVVVYAPTFRDDGNTDVYNLDFEKILEAFRNNDKKHHYVMLIRLHPNVPSDFKVKGEGKDIINVSKVTDPQIIWLASDIMISDYSSSPFDFMEMKKVAFFYWPDYSDKIRMSKRFFDNNFRINYTEEELINDIQTFDINKYQLLMDDFNKRIIHYNNGDASIKAAKKIESICLDKSYRSKNVR